MKIKNLLEENKIDTILKDFDFIITYYCKMDKEYDFKEMYIFINHIDLIRNEEKILSLNKVLKQWFNLENVTYITKPTERRGFFDYEKE